MKRIEFLALSGLTMASFTDPIASWRAGSQGAGSFDFVFFTDTHIQPELAAGAGCSMCLKKIRSTVKADFAIQGGDHVFDASGVHRERANSLYDLYAKTEQDLGL